MKRCRCGTKKKKSLRKDYRPNSLNPLFGQMIEMEVEIPIDKNLVVSVMDRHHVFSGILVNLLSLFSESFTIIPFVNEENFNSEMC